MKSTEIYNTSQKTKQQLVNEFVVRTRQFDLLFKDIGTSKMEHPEQNYLIIGPRGSGKTTLVHRLKYAIEDDKKLNKWLLPLLLNEEQYHISQLLNLWETIADSLEQEFGFIGVNDSFQKHLNDKHAEKKCFDELLNTLKKNKKKIVLFLENIGDFLKKLNDIEVKRFREVLTNHSEIRVIGTSSLVLESLFDYSYPLLEFFKTVYLEGLSQVEIETVLLKLSELNNSTEKIKSIIEKESHRIQILRQFTGGVPRTVVLLFEILSDDKTGNSINDLKLLVDRVTPLFKARMEELPAGMQKIVDAVAKSWDAVSVKELGEKLRMESKIVSAQLRQLEKNQVILKKETNTKNHLYQLSERFFNIWYLMRYGREGDKTKVIWLVKFFESWYSKNELEMRALTFVQSMQKGIYNLDAADVTANAYINSKMISPETKYKIVQMVQEPLPKNISRKIKMEENELRDLAIKHIDKAEYEIALKVLSEIKTIDDSTFFYKGLIYRGLKNHDLELKQYKDLLHSQSDYWREIAGLLMQNFLLRTKSTEDAIKVLEKEIKNGEKGLAYYLAGMYQGKKVDYEKSKIYYLKALEEGETRAALPIAFLNFIQRKNKKSIPGLIEKVYDEYLEIPINLFQYSLINLWIDDYESATKSFHEYCVSGEFDIELASEFFETLAYQKQFHTALKLMKQYALIEAYKPLYYAIMFHLQNEYPNEYLKMGDELKETVDDILKTIEVEYERLK